MAANAAALIRFSSAASADRSAPRNRQAEAPLRGAHWKHVIGIIATGARVALGADHAHAERLGEARKMRADATEADDQ